jgi:uncharacterized protein with PIN domain
MVLSADFRFYGSLNDFLIADRKACWFSYRFAGNPAIKDAIEALGVPHPEVQFIAVNNKPVNFRYKLVSEDKVEVYPFYAAHAFPEGSLAVTDLAGPPVFVVDVHLGKLAKALRKLGFDTCYQNDYNDQAIAGLAAAEDRIVLTRDVDLLKQKIILRGYWLRSQHVKEQLTEVITFFNLAGKFRPFSRCLECNGELEPVAKEVVWERLPPKTRLYFDAFFQCKVCKRVYWKGSHFESMQEFVDGLKRV